MKKILVVVDMQNDFIDGPLGTPEARAIVDNVCEKIRGEEWDRVYSTFDTHHADYLGIQEGEKLPVVHCIMGTDGWEQNDKVFEAAENQGHMSIFKPSFGSLDLPRAIDSMLMYNEYFEHTPTKDIELTLVGVCTDICVISNALLLKAHYPEMKIVVDASCCAGSTPEKHFMALEVMKSCQVDVVNEYVYDLNKVMQKRADLLGLPKEPYKESEV